MKPDLDAIRARCEAATPGPWELHDSGDSWRVYAQDEIVFDDGSAAGEYCTKCTVPDRDFFMAARTDIPALLAYIDELEARTTYTVGETEWASRIAHAEAQLAQLCGLSCLREGNAFRRGAEAMREAAHQACLRVSRSESYYSPNVGDECADAVRALPIPEKP